MVFDDDFNPEEDLRPGEPKVIQADKCTVHLWHVHGNLYFSIVVYVNGVVASFYIVLGLDDATDLPSGSG
jgi:hypothetical protein